MATQIQPDPIEPQSPDPQNPPSPPEDNPQPPTSGNPAGPTDNSRYLQLLEEQVRAQHQELERLRTQPPAPAAPAPPPPQPRNVEQERDAFFNDPRGQTTEVVRGVVQEALRETIQPLQEFVNEFRGQTARERLLAKHKANPAYSKYLNNARFGEYLNAILDKVPPAQLNDATIENALVSLIGAIAVGRIVDVTFDAPAPTPPANGSGPVGNIPAHVRPSAPPRPGQPARTTAPVLTELEKRLAKERNMTDEQYVRWRDMPPNEVATADFDKPKKEGQS